MPRASFGSTNQKRVWSFIEALVLAKVGSEVQAVVAGVELEYLNWKPRSKSAPQIRVKAQLTELSKLMKSKLDGEQIREIISLYLGAKFLGILEDKRRIKHGKGAENWHFILMLWSTDLEENQKKFNLAWKRRKSGETEEPISLDFLESTQKKQDNGSDIDELVREVRSLYRSKIQYDCDKIQFLNRQVSIDDLYTKIYILEDIPKLRSLDISERMQGFDPTADDPNSFYLGKVRGERIPGLDVVTDGCKLICLGAPGSGKTTYLFHVAIQCNRGELQANRVPIFIRLIEFADAIRNQSELSLLNYIDNLFHIEGVEQPQATETIVTQGRALILLDGLDEVPKDFSKLILSCIREFCRKYRKNSIIIACRTNALDYNFSDLKFTQVIVADFEQAQIEAFANKWFVAVAQKDKEAGEARAKQFIQKLGLREYKRIRDLAVTPILLNLICLTFENDTGDFPETRAKLYQRGINILLEEWDSHKWEVHRGSEGNEVYQNLGLEARKALLNHVAKITFDENRYFFEQEEIEKYIADYLRTLPNAKIDSLQRDSRAVLKSIEVEHGLLIERAPEIYSFSHLTFQEYFTAKWFCDRVDWQGLVSHIREKHWREVFLLTVELIPTAENAHEFLHLMKEITDNLIASDDMLQQLLIEVNQKASFIGAAYKKAAMRAFYIALTLNFPYELALKLKLNLRFEKDFTGDLQLDHTLFSALSWALKIDEGLVHARAVYQVLEFALDIQNARISALEAAHADVINSAATVEKTYEIAATAIKVTELTSSIMHMHSQDLKLRDALQKIKTELPERSEENREIFERWWKDNKGFWLNTLANLIIRYRNLHQWLQINSSNKDTFRIYYDANKLLVDCLNSGCVVSDEVRQEIEDTLLLPIAEIKEPRQ